MTKRICEKDDLIKDIIDSKGCHAEYQPIIDTKTQEIYAYEVLARFSLDGKEYTPDEVFSKCYHDIEALRLLEILAKECQFENRPKNNKKIFVNISPHSLSSDHCRKKWIDVFKDEINIVVEITESYDQKCIDNTKAFIVMLIENDIEFAVDDILQENTILSLEVITKASIIKIDKDFFTKVRLNTLYRKIMGSIIEYCLIENKMLIIEGIEDREDFELSKSMGIPFVQGYYFAEDFLYGNVRQSVSIDCQ